MTVVEPPRHWRGVPWPGAGELLVSEVFGPTLQGEGPSAGRAATFVRLGACHLSCVWCDTAYTWDGTRYDLAAELTTVPTAHVVDQVLASRAPLVVVTGGEPALQLAEVVRLTRELQGSGRRVEIETSGSLPLDPLLGLADRIVASPKLAHSGLPVQARLRWPVLDALAACESAVLKFVVRHEHDLDEVEQIVGRLGLPPGRVWVMPEGITAETVLAGMRALVTPVSARGWSLSGRTHVSLWGDERGR